MAFSPQWLTNKQSDSRSGSSQVREFPVWTIDHKARRGPPIMPLRMTGLVSLQSQVHSLSLQHRCSITYSIIALDLWFGACGMLLGIVSVDLR